MDLGLGGKTAAVMAASEGLGRAAADVLAREGAHVCLCARRPERLERTVSELRAAYPNVTVEGVEADVSRADDVRGFVDAAARLGGGSLDVLVCNSGGPPPKRFEELTDGDWRAAFELLVLSHVRALRAALPHLKRAHGAVVHILSTAVRQPIPHLLLSNSVRLALVGFAKTMATELAPHGVRVNGVLPGSFETARILELAEAQARERGVPLAQAKADRARDVPLARLGDPRELAEVIAFLASPRASYVTGTTVTVDGGVVRASFA